MTATSAAKFGIMMSRVWYTADTHFGHKRVSEYRGFDSLESHDIAIAQKWKEQVSKHDTVYVLGDIAVSGHRYAIDIFNTLPGRKHLIMGNHDIIHPSHERGHSRAEWERWLSAFDTIQPFLRKKLNNIEVLLSHFPYPESGDGFSREGSRYDQYRLPDMGLPLIHGHTHGTERAHDSGYSQNWNIVKNQFHVGWDAWQRLVSQEEVIQWLNETYITVSDEDYEKLLGELDGK